MNIKRIQIIQGKGELNSRAGKYLSGSKERLEQPSSAKKMALSVLPKNFHTRRSDAIVDRDILLTQIVLLCGMVAFNVLRSIGQEVVALAEYAQKKIKVARENGSRPNIVFFLVDDLQEVRIYGTCSQDRKNVRPCRTFHWS